MQEMCPCHSGQSYQECCKPYHEGINPPNALLLMRSRYSAYAKQLPEYIIKTTHKANPHYKQNHSQWAKEICQFCKQTQFEGLQIMDFTDGNDQAFVTFLATLKQGGKDVSFAEKSYFEKVEGCWVYHSGTSVR